jgi:hypothetical protein
MNARTVSYIRWGKELKPAQMAILLRMAIRCNRNDEICRPSIEQPAMKTGHSAPTVRRVVLSLDRDGLPIDVRNTGSWEYLLHLEQLKGCRGITIIEWPANARTVPSPPGKVSPAKGGKNTHPTRSKRNRNVKGTFTLKPLARDRRGALKPARKATAAELQEENPTKHVGKRDVKGQR